LLGARTYTVQCLPIKYVFLGGIYDIRSRSLARCFCLLLFSSDIIHHLYRCSRWRKTRGKLYFSLKMIFFAISNFKPSCLWLGGKLYWSLTLNLYFLLESMTSEVDHSHVAFVCFFSPLTLSVIFTDAQGGEMFAGNYFSVSK